MEQQIQQSAAQADQEGAIIKMLCQELTGAVTNLAAYHSAMQRSEEFYERSAFYPRKAGDKPTQNNLFANYIEVFANMNIQYLADMGTIKVDAQPGDREAASVREKILLATHRQSGTEELMDEWADDGTIQSVAFSEVKINFQKRCVEVLRHDPKHCFWKKSSDNKITAFWIVYPISLQEAQNTYNVTPTADSVAIDLGVRSDPHFNFMDGQQWFTMAIRLDETSRVAWIGNRLIEEPHEHLLGVIPIDRFAPFKARSRNKHHFGSFYIDRLIPLQAELNDTIRRRSNIVKRLSNPIIWGRNIKLNTYDDVKQALQDAETGVLGLGKDGEVGILQLQELKTLYEHEASLKGDMQRLSGFAAASFGESVGANTSGDALGMYFTPTAKHVKKQQTRVKLFMQSINAKILRAYDVLGSDGQPFTLEAYSAVSTLHTANPVVGYQPLSGNRFSFTNKVIAGNYTSRYIPPAIVPKNELEEKRLVIEAVRDKFISLETGHEMWDIESPADERLRMMQENAEPLLNPLLMASLIPQPPQKTEKTPPAQG